MYIHASIQSTSIHKWTLISIKMAFHWFFATISYVCFRAFITAHVNTYACAWTLTWTQLTVASVYTTNCCGCPVLLRMHVCVYVCICACIYIYIYIYIYILCIDTHLNTAEGCTVFSATISSVCCSAFNTASCSCPFSGLYWAGSSSSKSQSIVFGSRIASSPLPAFVCMLVYLFVNFPMWVCMCVCVYIYTYIHWYVLKYMCVCTYIYTYRVFQAAIELLFLVKSSFLVL